MGEGPELRHVVGTLWPLIVQYVMGRVRRAELVPSTAAGYWSALAVLDTVHGQRPLAQVGKATMERWLEHRAPLMASTKRTQWSNVSTFLDFLVDEKHIHTNPCRKMKAPSRPKRPPRNLDGDAIDALLAVAPDARARAIIWLERGAALRRVEVHRANIEDWSRRDHLIRVTGKRSKVRNVPLTPSVEHALDAYLTEWPAASGPIIRSYTTGRRLASSTLSHLMAEWMYEAGVKHAPHDGVSGHALRHTKATEVIDEVGDLRYVMELLGHEDLSSSQIYVGLVAMAKLRAVMERIELADSGIRHAS